MEPQMKKTPYSTPEAQAVPFCLEENPLVGTNRADDGYDNDNDLGEI